MIAKKMRFGASYSCPAGGPTSSGRPVEHRSFITSRKISFYNILIMIAILLSTGAQYGIAIEFQPLRNKFVSVTFLKKTELRIRDNWHSPALPPLLAAQNLSKYGAIWCGQLAEKYNLAGLQYYQKIHSGRFLLYYISAFSSLKHGSFVTLDYEYINKSHPEWFLLKDNRDNKASAFKNPDNRIRWAPDTPGHPYYDRFFLDVGNPEFQKWAAERILQKLEEAKEGSSRIVYSGIGMDNVLLSVWYKKMTALYPNWKYAYSCQAWKRSFFDFLNALHRTLSKNRYILILNHTTDYGSNSDGKDWKILESVSDGLMDENALGPPGQSVWAGSRWDWSIRHHKDIVDHGLVDWWVASPSEGKNAGSQFFYIFSSFMLVYEPGNSFISAGTGAGLDLQKALFDYNFGKPVGPLFKSQSCIAREFENALILVNSGRSEVHYTIEGKNAWYDWKSKNRIQETTIHPGKAVILTKSP